MAEAFLTVAFGAARVQSQLRLVVETICAGVAFCRISSHGPLRRSVTFPTFGGCDPPLRVAQKRRQGFFGCQRAPAIERNGGRWNRGSGMILTKSVPSFKNKVWNIFRTAPRIFDRFEGRSDRFSHCFRVRNRACPLAPSYRRVVLEHFSKHEKIEDPVLRTLSSATVGDATTAVARPRRYPPPDASYRRDASQTRRVMRTGGSV